MKKPLIQNNYESLTILCEKLGLVPYEPHLGAQKGIYTMKGLSAPVDLTACAETEIAILKTALKQLSESVSESYYNAIERSMYE